MRLFLMLLEIFNILAKLLLLQLKYNMKTRDRMSNGITRLDSSEN
jgi:hypothetical protein